MPDNILCVLTPALLFSPLYLPLELVPGRKFLSSPILEPEQIARARTSPPVGADLPGEFETFGHLRGKPERADQILGHPGRGRDGCAVFLDDGLRQIGRPLLNRIGNAVQGSNALFFGRVHECLEGALGGCDRRAGMDPVAKADLPDDFSRRRIVEVEEFAAMRNDECAVDVNRVCRLHVSLLRSLCFGEPDSRRQ